MLSQQAACLEPGESGLVALDWNGQLTGAMVGMTLRTTPAEQYRALLESAAFGARTILELFEKTGILVEEVVACGGIVGKNPLMMQIYADVLNRLSRLRHQIRVRHWGRRSWELWLPGSGAMPSREWSR